MSKLQGLIFDLPDSKYHEVLTPEEAHYSSSQFKDALKDIEYFYKKYISRELKEEVSSTTQGNFDVGSAYHGMVLEPEKFNSSFVVFDGAVKRGRAYDLFLEENKGKTILSTKQMELVEFLVKANRENEVAQRLLQEGIPEASLFIDFHGLKVKVRADWICFNPVVCSTSGEVVQEPFIMDLKSTTGNPKDAKEIQRKISSLHYDLSASLYMDVFNTYLKSKGEPLIKEWKFCFDSKDTGTSKVWTASKEMLEIGRRKYMQALEVILKNKSQGWVFKDEDSILNASPFDVQEWLNKKEEITLPPIPMVEADEDLL
jgi:hypothetical protein